MACESRGRLLLAVLVTGSLASAADLALVGGAVFPQPGARPIPDAVLLIQGNRIAGIGPRGSLKIPKGARILDCSGASVVAGFWNSHVHITTSGLLRARSASAADLEKELEAMFQRWGFTTVFDIGSVLENTLALRARIERGEVRGPRILTTGEPLWTEPPIYIRGFLAAHQIRMPALATAEEAVEHVRRLAKQGANGIKLFTGSMQGAGKVLNMPPAMIRASSVEAHRRGLPVFAHPQNAAGLESAAAGGVDILAHTAPDSPPWTPDFVSRMKAAGLALIPTLTLFDFEGRKAGMPEAQRERWIEKMMGELRAYSQAGGEVLFGTDVGYTDHFDTALEFELMRRAGLDFAGILAALTTHPARRFGRPGEAGRLAQGMRADIAVLEGDPEKDIAALSRIRYTVREGRLLYPAR